MLLVPSELMLTTYMFLREKIVLMASFIKEWSFSEKEDSEVSASMPFSLA